MRSPDLQALRAAARRPLSRLARLPTRWSRPARPAAVEDAASGGRGAGDWWEEHRDEAEGVRPFALYAPPHLPPDAPLVVMLHGCRQDPADMAAGTGANLLADRHGFGVVYPRQTIRYNARRCWNWFRPEDQAGGGAGEPGIIWSIVDEAATKLGSDPRRIYVAGMSAGGAMASVLATAYPDRVAAAGVHSGVAYGVAADGRAALAAMRGVDPAPSRAGARAALAVMGDAARVMPTIVVHGSADRTVAAVNAERVTRQWMLANRLVSGGSYDADFSAPDREERRSRPDGHDVVVRQWTHRMRVVQEHWLVDGLGHAWSGGAMHGSYTDPRGPNATAAMWRFFEHHRLPA